MSEPSVRRFREGDEAFTTALLYESSGGMYDRYAGNRRNAERAISRALGRSGTTASADVVWVADLVGQGAGVMAAMPFDEWTPRAYGFLRVTLRSIPPWRWPAALLLYRASGRTAPEPPQDCFYVDSLATEVSSRRRGVARALLGEAERQALERGLGLGGAGHLDRQPPRPGALPERRLRGGGVHPGGQWAAGGCVAAEAAALRSSARASATRAT